MRKKQEEVLENIKTLEHQLEEANDKYLRIYAEYDNYRKRAQKEKEDLVVTTKSMMLSSILDMDNDLAFALKQIDDEGVKLITQKLNKFLKSLNVEEIQTSEYDENIHEVISVIPTGKTGIHDVVSKGYKIGDKILRYPKVVLSK